MNQFGKSYKYMKYIDCSSQFYQISLSLLHYEIEKNHIIHTCSSLSCISFSTGLGSELAG
jgi:hypothetical protein